MCYNTDFSLSEDESSCDEGEDIHAYRGPSVIAPEEIAALSRAVSTSEPVASSCSSTSVDRLFVSVDVSTDAEEDQGEFRGGK